MKYYIPTSSLNFNNILSTESLSPKAFYNKRGFGYSRWFTVEENCIEHLTLLYGTPHMFERPMSDIEDHPMLIEIETDETFPQLAEDIFYTDRTIYFNPWQTKFIFFNEKDRTTAMSLSDSSLETKLVRLYKRRIYVQQFEGTYTIVQVPSSLPVGDMNKYVEDDYIINKMKGLLYGYYIGANFSSSKEHVQKLDTLREIQNIFLSVLSSYDRVPSNIQRNRLNQLFDYLDSLQPIYIDLEKEISNKQLVDRIFSIFRQHGYIFTSVDRTKLIYELQSDGENNQSVAWVNREISHTKTLMESYVVNLDPDEGEIIISPKDKVVAQKAITDSLLASLFITWTNDVLCSKSFNGKINSIKEVLSDEITKSAKNVIGAEWDNSPIRTYLNQLRRHVRGEEFNQIWDNGLLSSISAVLIKGDDWELLLNFMQNKGMYDYRIPFAFYGVLNGFANLTRDFTDLLLNKESNYVSNVYCEMYGQLFDKRIPEPLNTPSKDPIIREKEISPKDTFDDNGYMFILQILKFKDPEEFIKRILELSVERQFSIKQSLDDILSAKKYKKATKQSMKAKVAYELIENRENQEFLKNKIKMRELKLTQNEQKQILEYLSESPSFFGVIMDDTKNDATVAISNSSKEEINLKQTIIEIPLSSKDFIHDSNARSFIKTLLYIKPYLDSIIKDITYIQKEYQDGGQYAKGGKKESDPSNNQVIKHLGNLIKKVHKEHPIPEDIVDRLTRDLLDRYNVK